MRIFYDLNTEISFNYLGRKKKNIFKVKFIQKEIYHFVGCVLFIGFAKKIELHVFLFRCRVILGKKKPEGSEKNAEHRVFGTPSVPVRIVIIVITIIIIIRIKKPF